MVDVAIGVDFTAMMLLNLVMLAVMMMMMMFWFLLTPMPRIYHVPDIILSRFWGLCSMKKLLIY